MSGSDPPWVKPGHGATPSDAPAMFRAAAEWYHSLFFEIDAMGRGNFTAQELQEFARSRRAHLETLLSDALNQVEHLTIVASLTFP